MVYIRKISTTLVLATLLLGSAMPYALGMEPGEDKNEPSRPVFPQTIKAELMTQGGEPEDPNSAFSLVISTLVGNDFIPLSPQEGTDIVEQLINAQTSLNKNDIEGKGITIEYSFLTALF